MCEFCNEYNNKYIEKDNLSIEICETRLCINYNGRHEGSSLYININFCPMCGRKLEEVNEDAKGY